MKASSTYIILCFLPSNNIRISNLFKSGAMYLFQEMPFEDGAVKRKRLLCSMIAVLIIVIGVGFDYHVYYNLSMYQRSKITAISIIYSYCSYT